MALICHRARHTQSVGWPVERYRNTNASIANCVNANRNKKLPPYSHPKRISKRKLVFFGRDEKPSKIQTVTVRNSCALQFFLYDVVFRCFFFPLLHFQLEIVQNAALLWVSVNKFRFLSISVSIELFFFWETKKQRESNKKNYLLLINCERVFRVQLLKRVK